MLTFSRLLSDVMVVLWGDNSPDAPKVALAVASYVKNHRVNAENAFEVIRIMWPDSKVSVRPPESTGDEVYFDVVLPDGSMVLVGAVAGIGSSLEVIS